MLSGEKRLHMPRPAGRAARRGGGRRRGRSERRARSAGGGFPGRSSACFACSALKTVSACSARPASPRAEEAEDAETDLNAELAKLAEAFLEDPQRASRAPR